MSGVIGPCKHPIDAMRGDIWGGLTQCGWCADIAAAKAQGAREEREACVEILKKKAKALRDANKQDNWSPPPWSVLNGLIGKINARSEADDA